MKCFTVDFLPFSGKTWQKWMPERQIGLYNFLI